MVLYNLILHNIGFLLALICGIDGCHDQGDKGHRYQQFNQRKPASMIHDRLSKLVFINSMLHLPIDALK